MRWSHDTTQDGPRAQFHAATALLGNVVVTGTDRVPVGFLYAFDSTSGRKLWQRPFESGVSALTVGGDRLALVTALGDLVVVDPRRAIELFRVSPSAPQKESVSQPVFDGSRLYFAAVDGSVRALDPRDGRTIWQTTFDAPATTSLALVGDNVIAGLANGKLVALSRESGATVRETKIGERLFGSIVVHDSLLFALAFEGEQTSLVALDASLTPRWKQKSKAWMSFTPLRMGDSIVMGDEQQILYAYRISDGVPQWTFPIDGVPRGLAFDGETLYVGTLQGKVFAFSVRP